VITGEKFPPVFIDPVPSTSVYPPVFADPRIERDFTRDGYTVLPLLDENEVGRLKAAYAENVPELPDPIFMTGVDTDLARRKRLGERLYEVLGPPLARLMPELTVVTGRNFVVKRGADDAGRMLMHQDFTFVDQNVDRGVHVWVPLVDVNHENGCLKVSPGSHRLINRIAAVGALLTPYDEVREVFEAECTLSVPMKAGEAFIFDERTMHGSEPNKIPADRPAANIAFVRRGLKQRIHFVNPETPGVLDVYEVDHEFAIQYSNTQDHSWIDPDAVRKIGTVAYSVRFLTVDDIEPLRIGRPAAFEEPPAAVKEAVSDRMPPAMAKMKVPSSDGFFSRLFGGKP
jgi:hypothetical protein